MRSRPSPEALFAAELCHRVANEFAALSAMVAIAKRAATGQSRELLEQGEKRVNSFAALHRLLIAPTKPDTVELSSQIEKVCLTIAETRLAPIAVSLTLRAEQCETSARIAWMLSVLVSEILTNAAKHAFRGGGGGTIVVTLEADDRNIALRIVDDGTGDVVSGSPMSGAGSNIIAELARTLGGTVTRVSTPQGTIVEVIASIDDFPRPPSPQGESPRRSDDAASVQS
ncbi:sensor histidine kinase [Sphingomonas sp. NFX23]|uniref:sensor histidine kinase n=1 Tax=Sphingomonas sp. NFX23 TaxID=2819532 RepID=UPI003CEE5668